MPWVVAATVTVKGIPHTSHARRNAAAAAAMADFHGARRTPARRIASRIGGSAAINADNRMLPPTGS
jgi:hypothetical protein